MGSSRTTQITRCDIFALGASTAVGSTIGLAMAAAPAGQLVDAVHISLAPTWFDPAETLGLITPYMLLYALHDAMVKPMPGESQATASPSPGQSTEDGMSYDFILRKDVKFHNGEKVTADDVKFSFERYRGANQGTDAMNALPRSRSPTRGMSGSA